MPTLFETCSEIHTGLQRAKVANQTKHEISALQERIREWSRVANTRQTLLHKSKVVDASLWTRQDIASDDAQVRTLVAAAKKVLQDGGNVQALAKENLWMRLIALAESSNERLRSAAKEEWRSFVEGLGLIESPSTLETRMLKTPANQALLDDYKEQFAKAQTVLRAELPTSDSDKTTLASVVKTMQDLREQLKSLAPEAVRMFLRAVESGGASLAMATTEVLDWIRTHDDLGHFVIKPKGMSTWR
jgi:hypothetical protein